MALSTLCITLIASRYGMIKSRFSFISIMTASIYLSSLGFIVLYLSTNFTLAILGLLFMSMGMALFLPNINLWVNTVSPEAYRGRAIGGLTTSHFLGRFFSPFIAQPLTDQFGLSSTFGIVSVFLLIFGTVIYFVSLRIR